jgi:hypothetical protein
MKNIVRIQFRVECRRHYASGLDKYRVIPLESMNGYRGIQIFKFGRPNEDSGIINHIKKRDVDPFLTTVDLSAVCIAGDIRWQGAQRSGGAVYLPGEEDGAGADTPRRHTAANPLLKRSGQIEFQEELGHHRAFSSGDDQTIHTLKALLVTNDNGLNFKSIEMGDMIQKSPL